MFLQEDHAKSFLFPSPTAMQRHEDISSSQTNVTQVIEPGLSCSFGRTARSTSELLCLPRFMCCLASRRPQHVKDRFDCLLQDKNLTTVYPHKLFKISNPHSQICCCTTNTPPITLQQFNVSPFFREHKMLHFLLIKMSLFSNTVILLLRSLFSKNIFTVLGIKHYLYLLSYLSQTIF